MPGSWSSATLNTLIGRNTHLDVLKIARLTTLPGCYSGPAMGLEGKRVLVVEDEPMIAMLVEDILTDLGCVIIGPAARLTDAMLLAECEALDLAILDVNLGDGDSLPVAALLESRKIPFAFATGYGESREPFRGAPILLKPYRAHEMASLLQSLIS